MSLREPSRVELILMRQRAALRGLGWDMVVARSDLYHELLTEVVREACLHNGGSDMVREFGESGYTQYCSLCFKKLAIFM